MSMLFHRARAETTELVADVMQQYHGDLLQNDVTVGVLMAEASEGEPVLDARGRPVPMLKHQGYAAAATIKVTPYKQRVLGTEDAVLTIDALLWNYLKPEERIALVDHELTHLELQRDDEDQVKLDDQGRPKLKLRLHDHQIGVFDSVIRRHGNASLDLQAVRVVTEAYRQQTFGWASDVEGPADEPDLGGVVSEAIAEVKGKGKKAATA